MYAAKIVVVGDSHCLEFTGIPNVSLHYLGPITMHRIGRGRQKALNLKNVKIAAADAIVFAFGEIDVRCHIGRQRDEFQRSYEEITITVDRLI